MYYIHMLCTIILYTFYYLLPTTYYIIHTIYYSYYSYYSYCRVRVLSSKHLVRRLSEGTNHRDRSVSSWRTGAVTLHLRSEF